MPFVVANDCINTASCKWRDAQRAMHNRQFIGYTLRHLERNVRGRLFDSEGGGGSAGKFISMWRGLGKIYFRVNMVNRAVQCSRQLLETVMLLKAIV